MDKEAVNAWINDYGAKLTSYLLLSTHYNDLYWLTRFGLLLYTSEDEAGSGEAASFDPLFAALKERFAAGGDTARVEIRDFFDQLRFKLDQDRPLNYCA